MKIPANVDALYALIDQTMVVYQELKRDLRVCSVEDVANATGLPHVTAELILLKLVVHEWIIMTDRGYLASYSGPYVTKAPDQRGAIQYLRDHYSTDPALPRIWDVKNDCWRELPDAAD